ncbi:hypothetical protein [Streptomyces eurocidicus]|uniref:Integral membrane protein n=1 Tax=Streptomyces eurocidicus TaxID=66423 RepID=A0A7W8F3H6_STREU|nr:hypothetical protein [Streptomyces eurocidicus]MBB5119296.1 hypothetical protein [Streptomyces eurocidicus]MBF6053120.1 hypothetical protein [Streptomyces eurocidicus]
MSGSRLGLLSLRVDALYCLLVGLLIASTAPLTATTVQLPALVVVSIGGAVVLWAGVVWWLSLRPLTGSLRLVLAANALAACVLAAVSVVAASVLVLLTLVAVAIDVAAFAGSQIVALRRLAREPI